MGIDFDGYFVREREFYHLVKKLAESYFELAGYASNYKEHEEGPKPEQQEQPRRKVTRSVFAMKN